MPSPPPSPNAPAPVSSGKRKEQWSTYARDPEQYGARWQRLRKVILERDHYLCQCRYCKAEGILKPAHHVDHIVQRASGGTDDPSNLQAINADCHRRKTDEENGRRHQFGCTLDGLPLDPSHPWAKQAQALRGQQGRERRKREI